MELIQENNIVDQTLIKSLDDTGTQELFLVSDFPGLVVKRIKLYNLETENRSYELDGTARISLPTEIGRDSVQLEVTESLIILTCSACKQGMGWIKFYDRSTMKLLSPTIEGSADNFSVGGNFAISTDILGVTNLWYTSKKGEILYLNLINQSFNTKTLNWTFDVKGSMF